MDSERRRRALLGYALGTTSAEPMAHLASKGAVSAGPFESKATKQKPLRGICVVTFGPAGKDTFSRLTTAALPVPTCSSRTETWPSKLKGLSLVATQAPAVLQVAM